MVSEPKLNDVNGETVEKVSQAEIENLVKNGRTEKSKSTKATKVVENGRQTVTQVKTTEQKTAAVEPYSKTELGSILGRYMTEQKHPLASASITKLSASDLVAFIRAMKIAVDDKRMPSVEAPKNPAK